MEKLIYKRDNLTIKIDLGDGVDADKFIQECVNMAMSVGYRENGLISALDKITF